MAVRKYQTQGELDALEARAASAQPAIDKIMARPYMDDWYRTAKVNDYLFGDRTSPLFGANTGAPTGGRGTGFYQYDPDTGALAWHEANTGPTWKDAAMFASIAAPGIAQAVMAPSAVAADVASVAARASGVAQAASAASRVPSYVGDVIGGVGSALGAAQRPRVPVSQTAGWNPAADDASGIGGYTTAPAAPTYATTTARVPVRSMVPSTANTLATSYLQAPRRIAAGLPANYGYGGA